jgi:hypothetical protein
MNRRGQKSSAWRGSTYKQDGRRATGDGRGNPYPDGLELRPSWIFKPCMFPSILMSTAEPSFSSSTLGPLHTIGGEDASNLTQASVSSQSTRLVVQFWHHPQWLLTGAAILEASKFNAVRSMDKPALTYLGISGPSQQSRTEAAYGYETRIEDFINDDVTYSPSLPPVKKKKRKKDAKNSIKEFDNAMKG